MKSLGTVAAAAIQAGHRAGWALLLTLGDGTIYRWKDVPEAVTIGGYLYTSRPLSVTPPTSMDSSTLTQAAAKVADGDREISAALRKGLLLEAQAAIYELLSTDPATPLEAVLHLVGAVETVEVGEDWATFTLGPPTQPWALLTPPPISSSCRYTNIAQCSKVGDCAKNWAACIGNAQTAKFGGLRFLVTAGTVLTFANGQVTVTPYGG